MNLGIVKLLRPICFEVIQLLKYSEFILKKNHRNLLNIILIKCIDTIVNAITM